MTKPIPLQLDQTGSDVRAIWERHGFIPTTDAERRAQQKAHVPQCRCKFCEEARVELAQEEQPS